MGLDNKQRADLFGTNSYINIVDEITEVIKNAEASTLTGAQLLSEVYDKLNESKTPIMELRAFQTGAEAIAGDDVKLKDILKFITKKVTTNGDLNFLINLCKEEHFSELTRLNHPSPEATVKSIEDEFSKPGSVIEQGIKSGLFDGLKSKLLNRIKVDLSITEDKPLNESKILFNNNLVKYSPIGIKLEDIDNNRLLMLTESEIFSLDRVNKSFSKVTDNVNIPESHGRLMTALNSCGYSPETNSFCLNENWDFNLQLNANGEVTVNDRPIPQNKVKDLLLESVKTYVGDPMKVEGFNKLTYLKDADNFIALMENHKHLICLDTIEVIKNLNESSYVILDKSGVYEKNEPKVLSSSNGYSNKLFESYGELVSTVNTLLSQPITNLFESQLSKEAELINDRNSKIVSLNEAQKEINENIEKVRNLKNLAQVNSPAMETLNSQETVLLTKLNENIAELNSYVNDFTITMKK